MKNPAKFFIILAIGQSFSYLSAEPPSKFGVAGPAIDTAGAKTTRINLSPLNLLDDDKAIVICSEAIRLDPNYAEAYFRRGRAYENKGDFDMALLDFKEAARHDPGSSNYLYSLGGLYQSKRDYDKAIAAYTSCIELKEARYRELYYASRAGVFELKGDYDKAIADYSRALLLQPGDYSLLRYRGNVYETKMDFANALADYNEAVRLYPKVRDAYIDLARLLSTCSKAEFRDGKKALNHIQTVHAFPPDTSMGYDDSNSQVPEDVEAAVYAEVGDFDKAIKFQTKYLEIFCNPSQPKKDWPEYFKKEAKEAPERLKLYQGHKPYHGQK